MPSIKDDLYNLIFNQLQHKSLTNLTDEEVQLFFDTWVNTGVSGTSDVPDELPQGVMYYDEEAKVLYIGQTDGSVQQLIALDDILRAENYNDDEMIIKGTESGIEVWKSITKADVRGFRRYAGLVSQYYDEDLSEWKFAAPQLIENTIGTTIAGTGGFRRVSTGVYTLTFTTAVMPNIYKVALQSAIILDTFGDHIAGFLSGMYGNNTTSQIEFRVYNFANNLTDGLLNVTPFEVIYTP